MAEKPNAVHFRENNHFYPFSERTMRSQGKNRGQSSIISLHGDMSFEQPKTNTLFGQHNRMFRSTHEQRNEYDCEMCTLNCTHLKLEHTIWTDLNFHPLFSLLHGKCFNVTTSFGRRRLRMMLPTMASANVSGKTFHRRIFICRIVDISSEPILIRASTRRSAWVSSCSEGLKIEKTVFVSQTGKMVNNSLSHCGMATAEIRSQYGCCCCCCCKCWVCRCKRTLNS